MEWFLLHRNNNQRKEWERIKMFFFLLVRCHRFSLVSICVMEYCLKHKCDHVDCTNCKVFSGRKEALQEPLCMCLRCTFKSDFCVWYHKYDFTIATSIFGSSKNKDLEFNQKCHEPWAHEIDGEREGDGKHRPTHKMHWMIRKNAIERCIKFSFVLSISSQTSCEIW